MSGEILEDDNNKPGTFIGNAIGELNVHAIGEFVRFGVLVDDLVDKNILTPERGDEIKNAPLNQLISQEKLNSIVDQFRANMRSLEDDED